MNGNTDENLSDEEIFFGKITLKEVKKCIFMNQPHRQTITCITANNECNNEDESIRIIETHSEPDLSVHNILESDLKSISSPNFVANNQIKRDSDVKSDDSFIRLEKMVSDLCMSPTENKSLRLDSTLDVVDFILNNGELKKEDTNDSAMPCLDNLNLDIQNEENTKINSDIGVSNTPKVKTENMLNANNDFTYYTKHETDNLNHTPRNKNNVLQINQNDNIFKTPKNPVSSKKQMGSIKKTPNRVNAYQHIKSPVASYIKNCPQVPLVKDVHPRKPLPGTSSIPQLIKTSNQPKAVNKENIQIPSIAYKSAKKTKMLTAPTQEKMPQGEWANKLTTTLKKPVVVTHNHRIVNSAIKNLNKRQEDSFDNLPVHQADLSVCTKKSAFC